MQEIKWSYSGLKDFVNCPRQYNEVKVLKRYEKKATVEMRYGTQVHSALEDYVKEGKPLAKNYEHFGKQLDPLRDMEGIKYPEYRMALTINRQPCTFGAKDYWVRGIADLMVVDGDQGYIVDYKTGSNKYPDPKQLQLMALMGFEYFPEVTHFKAGLLFVAHNDFVTSEYQREKIDKYWDDFAPQLKRLQLSYENGVWQENPTPLCGWCPVSDCTHYKGK
jgi:CRISPR/Cas system-associated exonuclease Cas4 (RecB family)